jgi:hypothetical protein
LDLWTTPTIIAGALLSVGFAFLSVTFMGRSLNGYEREHLPVLTTVTALAAAFSFMVVTISVVVGAIASAFRRGDERAVLTTVVVAYFSLILVFASIYFVASFVGDYESASFTYHAYKREALAGLQAPVIIEQQRALGGVVNRFWSGVDWPQTDGMFPGGLPPGSYAVDPAEMRKIAGMHSLAETVRFLPESRYSIFGDCLHLSVITMTTVGYGDVWPRSLAARIAADIEALCYTILLIFAVGMIFGNVRGGQKNS